LLSLNNPRPQLPDDGAQPPAHPPLPSPHEWQGGEIHPHPLGRLGIGPVYGTSNERTAALDGWLWTYNHRRPHGSLGHKPPIARLNELHNLPGPYI